MKRILSMILALALCLSVFVGVGAETSAAVSLSFEEVLKAATLMKQNMDQMVLPRSIPAGSGTLSPAQFEYFACKAVLAIDSGTATGNYAVVPMAEAATPSGSAKGQVPLADYVTMAEKIITFMETNGSAPNYSTSSNIGQMHYFDVVHMYAKILNFYRDKGTLPNYNTSEGWRGSYGENVVTDIPGMDPSQTLAATELYQLPAKYPRASGDYYQNMSYVIKTRQGKILVIDGGYSTGDYDPKYLYAFLQQVTGKAVPHVDAWFFTHNHNDHYGAFRGIANLYPNGITVDTIYHRYPTAEEITTYFSEDKPTDRVTALSYIPNSAKKLKNAEGGAVKIVTLSSLISGGCNAMLDFDEVHIDVLMTCEDLFRECDTDTAKYSGTLANSAYPAFSNKTLKQLVSTNFNESSTVFRLTVPGKSILITGDAAFACGIVLQKYHKAGVFNLKSDVVQVSHHGQQGLQKAVYALVDADVALWPAPSWVYNAVQSATNVRTYYARQWFKEWGTTCYASYNGPQTFKYGILRSADAVSIPEELKPLVFDGEYYAKRYADLMDAYGIDEGKLYEHYVNYGIEEGRCASPYFDVKFYMNQNGQSFRESMKGDYEKAFRHFLSHVDSTDLMKLSENFDAAYYAAQNPELKEQGITTELGLLRHYVQIGSRKNAPASNTFTDPMGGKVHENCNILPGVDGLCGTEGKTWGARCEACGVTVVEQKAISGNLHEEVTDPAVAPGCTETGLTEGKHCALCNAVLLAQQSIPATGHSYTYVNHDGESHTVGCERCDYTATEAHSYTEEVCICGAVQSKEPVVDESIVIQHTLNLASDISVNFVVKAELLKDYVNHSLLCRIPIYDGDVCIGTKTVTVEPWENGEYFYYTLTGLTAVQMGDVVTAQLCMEKDGQSYLSQEDSYSIAQYAYSQLDKPQASPSLKTLCADLLRYGREAQLYKGYRSNALADGAMTEIHRSYLSDGENVTFGNCDQILPNLETPVLQWEGKALNLASKVSVKYIFSLGSYTDPTEELYLKVFYVNLQGEITQALVRDMEVYDSSRGLYAFTFDGLLAAELRNIVDVAIFRGNTPLTPTLRYSPDTYGNNKTGGLLTLCKALFAYADSAKAYFVG
ncbi:MAG: MBL fold metallo-hydrolase [Oscillospiraceae bacterium]|nr:MBL fold metallo-hydrolase [Oscillospiraceae bacterium]